MIDCIGNQQHVRFLLLDHQNLGFIFPFGDGDTDSQHLTTMLNVVGSLQWSQYLIDASHHFTININCHDESLTDKLRPTVSHEDILEGNLWMIKGRLQ